jgi:hypothetical protein
MIIISTKQFATTGIKNLKEIRIGQMRDEKMRILGGYLNRKISQLNPNYERTKQVRNNCL